MVIYLLASKIFINSHWHIFRQIPSSYLIKPLTSLPKDVVCQKYFSISFPNLHFHPYLSKTLISETTNSSPLPLPHVYNNKVPCRVMEFGEQNSYSWVKFVRNLFLAFRCPVAGAPTMAMSRCF